jgi:serine/threonine-protein kinase HipA
MDCHFQIFIEGRWHDAATLSEQGVFEYELDYAFDPAAAPLSLCYPVNAQRYQRGHWPAFFYDLIPQGAGRKFLLGKLALSDGPGADFALVAAGAFNTIGRVRVAEAVEYFYKHIQQHNTEGTDRGFTMGEILARGDEFHERMMVHSMLAAGTTGVQGAAPKYLLTQDHHGLWHADGALPDGEAAAHYIVKRPRGPSADDKKVLRNEAAYMRVAEAMGIRTQGVVEHHGDSLFIPRFDRMAAAGQVIRLHQESAASLAGQLGFDAKPSQFDLLAAIRRVVSDKTAETIEFLKRDVLNLAMRNTDNHARNTAVQVAGDVVRLTPLFDFAPMYLDPEGITRAARWYHPETRKELGDWTAILEVLGCEDEERGAIEGALHAFGARLENLEAMMRGAGVEDDIVAFLHQSIETQLRQLAALGGKP